MNRLSRVHECYRRQTDDRQTTDGRAIAYSEREREFTFAKNPDKSELLTKDLKVATDCTVSGVIFSEFQGAMTRSQKKCSRTLV